MQFQRATKAQARLRMALIGPSGSGKTYSALAIAEHLGDRVALIDTEHGSASKYARRFNFDVLELAPPFDPRRYVEALRAGVAAGYDVVIIDSLSHAWMGQGGALEMVDKAAARNQQGASNSFSAWREVTPIHNQMVEGLVQAGCHLIVTMRAKQGHVQEYDEKQHKTVIRKVGMEAIQRDGLEYEFDVVADMDMDNRFIVSKSRCEAMAGLIVEKPGKDVADILAAWLSDGEPLPAPHEAKYETMVRYQKAEKALLDLKVDCQPYEVSAQASDDQVLAMIDKMRDAYQTALGRQREEADKTAAGAVAS